ncbi:hypothetical protein FE374_01015 [Georgenia yuyongxinii]|uniref:Uncharacterized protein n=1 Tax=Georgenia yuyongxinii TaxID=2589797 RepID=A0A5B8C5Y6_9MICO|nr:hypothetical protein [Georgenia yuyongxinii]QDC23396.1 hypothetical protein FE374_01015 [Georgenia yuyongxinii]
MSAREGPVLTDASDGYYDGMRLFPDDSVTLSGTRGERLEPSELAEGDRVEVWVGDACAESFPVQCHIEAVRLLGP